jgi:hypothetical protein
MLTIELKAWRPIVDPEPCTLNPGPLTPDPKPWTLNFGPGTLNPNSQTQNPLP